MKKQFENKGLLKKKYLLISIIIACFNSLVFSQYHGEQYISGIPNLIAGSNIELEIPVNTPLEYSVNSALVNVNFDFGQIYNLGSEHIYSATFDIQLSELNSAGNVLKGPVSYQLKLSTSDGEKAMEFKQVYQIQSSFDLLDRVNLEIINVDIDITNLTPEAQNYFNENLRLGLSYDIDLNCDVRNTDNELVQVSINPVSTDNETRIKIFSWRFEEDDASTFFQNYQFELLKLENYQSGNTDDLKISTKIDWDKALKIETQSQDKSLELTISEGSGYYTWRVRPVGSYFKGGIANYRNWGKWSDSFEQSEELDLTLNNNFKQVFYFTDPEEDPTDEEQDFNRNWIFSRFFAEEGKIKEQITYANGLNQVKQTQTYIPSQEKTIANQTILDFSGRPTLITLPVPVDNRISKYVGSLVTDESGKLYDASNFDTDDKIMEPDRIKQDATSKYSYYSDNNTTNYAVPDAGGYPYSRTLYKNDPTGRQSVVSGVGPQHRLGGQSNGKGTVRMFYGNPTDIELIRIFGDEAPDPKSVLKTTTIDQNNTISITYTSKEGNVIATSLSDDDYEDDALADIDDPAISQENVKTILTGSNLLGNEFISEKKLTFSQPTDLKLTYTAPCVDLQLGCFKVDGNCGYLIKFSIINTVTNEVFESNTVPLCETDEVQEIELTLSQSGWSDLLDPILTDEGKIMEGTYKIRKSIFTTASADAQVSASKERTRDDIRPIVDLFQGWLKRVESEEDLVLFYQDVQKFSYKLDSVQKNFKGMSDFDYSEENLKLFQANFDPVLNPDDPPYQIGGAYLGDFLFVPETGKTDEMFYRPGQHVYFVGEDDKTVTIDNLENQPKFISITGTCSSCGPILMPIRLIPEITCYTYKELIDDPEKGPDLWGYARAILYNYIIAEDESGIVIEDGISPEEELMIDNRLVELLNGYNETMINTMAYFMLTDKYITVNGDNEIPEVQYTCADLVTKWKGVIASYEEIIMQAANLDIQTLDGASKDEDEKNGDKDANTKDNFFDDAQPSGGGFLMKLFMKRKLKNRMKDLEFTGGDINSPKIDLNVDYKIIPEFLQQIGYKFAKIIEASPENSQTYFTDDLQDDFCTDPNGNCGTKLNNIYYNKSGSIDFNLIQNNELFDFIDENSNVIIEALPFIRNKVYAFKYYEYDRGFHGQKYWPVEVGHCFIVDANTSQKCYKPCSGEGRTAWDAQKRFYFYNGLMNFREYTAGPDDDSDILNQELLDRATEIYEAYKLKCPQLCQNREQDIKDKIMSLFLNNCYQVGGCPNNENVILQSDIQAMADEIISACQCQCDAIFDGYVPALDNDACVNLINHPLGTGYIWEQVAANTVPTILNEREQDLYDQIDSWEVVIAINDDSDVNPGYTSFCRCFDDFSAQEVYLPWQSSQSYYVNTTSALLSEGNLQLEALSYKQQIGYAALYRDDFPGNFSISVLVENYDINTDENNDPANTETGLMLTTVPEISKGAESIVNSNFVRIAFTDDGVITAETHSQQLGMASVTPDEPYYLKMDRQAGLFSFYYAEVPDEGEQILYQPIIINQDLSSYTFEHPFIALFLQTDGTKDMARAAFDDFDCGALDKNKEDNKDWMNDRQMPADECTVPNTDQKELEYSKAFEVNVQVD